MNGNEMRIFICYARSDNAAPQRWADRVKQQLQPVIDTYSGARLVELATGQLIQPAESWWETVQRDADQGGLAILLVSAPLLGSAHVIHGDLPNMLAGHRAGRFTLAPLFVSPVAKAGLRNLDFAGMQSFASAERPLLALNPVEQERELVRLADFVDDFLAQRVAGASRASAQARPLSFDDIQLFSTASTFGLESVDGILQPVWASDLRKDRYGVYAELRVKDVVQKLRWIAPGRFMMGSPADEPERFLKELQHEVVLSDPFWLADTACTQALWQAVTGADPSRGKGAQRPVDMVSWNDVVLGFLPALDALEPKLQAVLPTEAQWEYACRAGSKTPFSFGNTVTVDQVNYDGNYPYAHCPKGQDRARTIDVAALPANPWGLYQMHGNVWEWCADWYGNYGLAKQTDPTGPRNGRERVLRGGSWSDYAGYCRAACRHAYEPAERSDYVGFRFAVPAVPRAQS
ncbi:MAG: SUMF1/EgtB/PvdO family nonheme iron enzyme [Rhodocyclaceae bacterium]|nr:SUMF1/EgtB/PvdO family nonheme iron enzyme [Rhodocyclaceae bacterium]MBX3670563.1 SUMF1/EgtB/PvdO family nonheme iron enzyme [Rhodocyclaceae bacterium]